jgi:hypothetical protein
VALVDSDRAIGAVTRLLRDRLLAALQGLSAPQVPIADVTIGRPEPAQGAIAQRRLNLFLYGVEFDASLKNVSLDEGQPAPLWLVLRYLLTAFDRLGDSDSIEAYEIMGEGARVLQELNFMSLAGLPALTVAPLSEIPDFLKLTFDDASPDLLSKLMSGAEEHYRCSIAFQVRPVMIAPSTPPSYSLLVGVDYTTGTVPGLDAVHIPVLPSLGPTISSVQPEEFETGAVVAVEGTDLHIADLVVLLDNAQLPVTSQRTDRLTFEVSPSLEAGNIVSAGTLTLQVAQQITPSRRRRSDPLIAGLLPRLDSAVVNPGDIVRIQPANPDSPVRAIITLNGVLLGREEDDVFVALYGEAGVVQMFDAFLRPTTDQTVLVLDMPQAKAVLQADYRVILRVNGRQARNSPTVHLVAP